MTKIKVSVIIPVYNVAQYIEKCARSLFEQTLDSIEYIFVDDCGTDASMDILERIIQEYEGRINNIIILHNSYNLGLAATREIGMKAACGEYLISCDSDDWVEKDIYSVLYTKAHAENSDIVICNFYEHYPTTIKEVGYIPYEEPREFLNSTLSQDIHWSLCNKLIRTSLIHENNLYAYAGINTWEDVAVSTRACFYAKKISFVNMPLYHYNRQNDSSILHENKRRNIMQMKLCTDNLIQFFSNRNREYEDFILGMKIFVKNSWLMNKKWREEWHNTYPELHFSLLMARKSPFILNLCLVFLSYRISFPLTLLIKLSELKKLCPLK